MENKFVEITRIGFKNTLKLFLLISLCVFTSAQAMAASGSEVNDATGTQDSEIRVTGTVTDVTGEPLIGVTVMVEGTMNGTITDFDGNYSILVPSKESVLSFSYIGFLTEKVQVADQTTISIQLTDDITSLGEVVVTALGIKRETKALGYAMTEIKGDDLTDNSANPINALQGKAAGVDVAQSDGGMFGSTKILIRGASTLGANNQPIYVVDGVILENSVSDAGDADWSSSSSDWGNELKNLNPADFETVSILKGAAATALYGSRGLNGAIVITTKSGKTQKGLGVSLNQTFGVDYVYKQPDLQNVYGDGAISGYVDFGETDADGNYYSWDNQRQFYLNGNGEKKFNTWGCSFGPEFDGSSILGYDNKLTKYSPVKNNYRDMYDLGFNTTTNIAIQGGNESTKFYSSVNYKKATGTLGKNEFDRLTFLAKASHQLTDKINLEASMNFAASTPKNPQLNVGEYFATGYLGREYDPDYYKNKYKGTHGGRASSSYGDEYGSIPGVDLWWTVNENSSVQHETSFRPYLGLTMDLTSWLKFKGEGSYNYYYTSKEIKNPNYGYARTYDGGAGRYSITQTSKKQINADVNFMYNKDLNADLNLSGFVRGEVYDNTQTYTYQSTEGGLSIPDQYFIGNSVNTVSYDSAIEGTKRMLSVAAQASLAYKNQLFLDITGRNDWSSSLVYSDGTGSYSYFYPSVSLSGIISEMVELPSWVSFGKVRASWAQVGNDTNPYDINTAYTLKSNSVGGVNVNSLSVPTAIVSTDLKPEKKSSYEFGIDWRFLSNRIGVDAAYYKENTRNQIMDVSVPNESGVSSQKINAGNIQNSGIEVALNLTPYKSKDWQWDLTFTYTHNESKIISLDKSVADYILLDGSTNYGNFRVGSVAKVGGEYGLLMTDSKPLMDEESGLPILTYSSSTKYARMQRSGKEEAIGSVMPDFLGSMTTTVTYKNLSLHVGMDMRIGGYVASYGARYGAAYGYTEASLKYSSPKYGGVTWTSAEDGLTYSDGVIPEGIFTEGTSIAAVNGTNYTVAAGGETYKELYDKGILEPTHASMWHYRQNSWGQGVINDNWIKELDYIALREVSINYNCPHLANKLGLGSLSFALTGRNLGYLLNTAPAGVNPESVRGTSAYNFRMRSFSAYTANYMFTISTKF